MTQHIQQTIKVNVPATQIWQVMADFASVEKYATGIKTSPVINGIDSGLGAKRKCTFNDGSSLVEEIIQYQQGQGYRMQLSEYSMPLKSMYAEIAVKEIDSNSCEISMSSDYVVKGGIFGKLMGALLMGPMMKGVFKKVMTGLAYHAETGIRIETKLPTKVELDKLLLS